MKIGLAAKFLFPVCAWIIAATAILGWLVIERQSKEYMNLTVERGGSLVQFIAHDVWWGVELAPSSELKTTAHNAQSWSDFLYLAVVDTQGTVLTKQGGFDPERLGDAWKSDPTDPERERIIHKICTESLSEKRIIDISCPIFFTRSDANAEDVLFLDQTSQNSSEAESDPGEYAGRVHIGLDLSPVVEQTKLFARRTLLVGTLTILAGILSMLLIVRLMLGPLTDLRNATNRIAAGDFDVQIPIPKRFKDELSELGASFNQMVLHLNEARTRIEEYNKGLENLIEERTRELRQLQDYLHNILSSIPSAVAIFNQSFEIEYANQEFTKTFNSGETYAIRSHFEASVPIVSSESFKDQLSELNKDHYSLGTEFHWDSKIFFYRLFRVHGVDQIRTGIVIVDVTEERQLQQQLTQAEKLAGIGTLASGVAHEINNPLQGILGMAEAVMDEEELELIKEYTQDIITYAQQAGEIVKELSTYSRAARSDASMPLNVNTVIKSALRMSQHANNYTDILVTRELEDVSEIVANAGELQQVLVNLFNNAVHAMNGRGELIVKTWENGDLVLISVKDTGCGISPENISHIFEPFFTTKPPGKGTGLGLNVVYRIIQKYAGSISVDSQVGNGTTFTIQIPVVRQTHDENSIGG